MGKILLMSPELVNLIASGGVIERPESVVKELVENWIDANAKNIYIGIVNAGKTTIIVKDDGDSMNKEDAKMAFLSMHLVRLKVILICNIFIPLILEVKLFILLPQLGM